MEAPLFFTYTLTEVDSTMSYVSCLLFQEEVDVKGETGDGLVKAFVPKVIGIVSHWPFLNTYRCVLLIPGIVIRPGSLAGLHLSWFCLLDLEGSCGSCSS